MVLLGPPVWRRARWLLAGLAALATLALSPTASPSPPAGTALPSAAAIVKGPYLQALGATGVTIKLEIDRPGPARADVYRAGEGVPVATPGADGEQAFHAIRVEGLSPATAYEYVVSAGGATSERGGFTTAPTDARPFRFLAYGDSRTHPEPHAAVIRAMQTTPSDFLVNTGDMVAAGNNPDDWRTFFAIEGHLLRDRCAFVAVGNHELTRGDHAGEVAFLRYFAGDEAGRPLERLYSTFRWSNTRFFLLNAMDGWTGDERAWLRDALDRAAREPGLAHRIAVLHWGPFSSGPHGGNPALANGEVVAMMHERGVDLVLAGHDHAYERGEGRGLKYVITGGAGAELYPRKSEAPETRFFASEYHFVEVAIDGEHVSVTAHRPSGTVLERCGFQGSGSWDCDPPAPAPSASLAASGTPPRSQAGSACGCEVPGARGEWTGGAALLALLALSSACARRSAARARDSQP